ELPQIVKLERGLYAASFPLMKLMPAKFILDRAGEAGILRPGSLVAETTSGTFGLALSILCNLRGYKFTMVSDPVVDGRLRRRLEELGTTVDIAPEPAAVGGFQAARMARLRKVLHDNPGSFWPSQYDNAQNPGAYAKLAEMLTSVIGQIDCLVGTVGSGGSMCGTSASLRLVFPKLHAIGVDTTNSVLFGQPDGPRLVRGLGNSIMPKNVDHTTFDEVHWVAPAPAFGATRQLHQSSGMFAGGTSGTAYLVARWYARAHPDRTTVVIFPDEGHRYQDTIYDDDWLGRNNLRAPLPDAPCEVSHPADGSTAPWSCLAWKRRTYEQVMGQSFRAAWQS
ncbi:MAG TPA: cysteine synthase family protein, partial [Kofleriaceae bacterium]|nr:cysteine synthase family protein [Kofleriaceae bacterium]